jgi:hypothetical protein
MAGPFFQLFSAWMSDDEASTLLSFGFSGYSFGTIIIYPMSGALCSSNIYGFGGWSLIFYVPGKCISVTEVGLTSVYLCIQIADGEMVIRGQIACKYAISL